eukprot:3010794-Rhodomonas_salina.3
MRQRAEGRESSVCEDGVWKCYAMLSTCSATLPAIMRDATSMHSAHEYLARIATKATHILSPSYTQQRAHDTHSSARYTFKSTAHNTQAHLTE